MTVKKSTERRHMGLEYRLTDLLVVELPQPLNLPLPEKLKKYSWDDSLRLDKPSHRFDKTGGSVEIRYLIWLHMKSQEPLLSPSLPHKPVRVQGYIPDRPRVPVFPGKDFFPQDNVWGDLRSYLAGLQPERSYLYLFKTFIQDAGLKEEVSAYLDSLLPHLPTPTVDMGQRWEEYLQDRKKGPFRKRTEDWVGFQEYKTFCSS